MHKVALSHIRNVKEVPVRERKRAVGRQGSHGIHCLPPTIFYVVFFFPTNKFLPFLIVFRATKDSKITKREENTSAWGWFCCPVESKYRCEN